jgi:co-chaperonin GroES (HSP10)
LDEVTERKVGAITVSTNSDQFAEGTVVAVGPGSGGVAGGHTETFDLFPGARVLVKHQDVRQMGQGLHKVKTGTEYTLNGEKVTIFEQGSIIGVITADAVLN